ncbi:TIGR00366 family protein, partial [Nocardiopsis alba]|uniref:TIGR00366 family protein n=1 Tax=Nocardiopsis alba TaxID=53437 RepID=UPI00340E86C9
MRRFGNALAAFSTRWVPDAFVFAVILSGLVFGMALFLTDRTPAELVGDWYGGFWNLLEFGMQMTLVLVTGYALASSPPARRAIVRVAGLARGPMSAVGVTALGVSRSGAPLVRSDGCD